MASVKTARPTVPRFAANGLVGSEPRIAGGSTGGDPRAAPKNSSFVNDPRHALCDLWGD
jgi:hypothetical protein